MSVRIGCANRSALYVDSRAVTIATWGRPGQVAWPGTFVRDFGPLVLSAAFGAIGFTPVGALALTIFGLWSLSVGTVVMIVPGAITALVLGFTFPRYGRFALEGLAAGLVAVFVYDLVRWTFVGLGWWGDFIPNIGGWLNGTSEPDWVLGYTFRWLGDGGGMGVAFMVAARVLVPSLSMRSSLLVGVTYGLAIWLCLLMTLVAAPLGQTLLFPLTPVTFVLSCIGHIVYGAVLGYALGSIRLATRPYLWIMRQA